MKKLLTIITLTILMIPTVAFAKDDTIDYKTSFKTKKVEITDRDNMYVVANKESGDVIMEMEKSPAAVFATTNVCVRKVPYTGTTRYGVLEKHQGVVQLAKANGWSLVRINSRYFFIWNQYLTETVNKNSVLIFNIDKDTGADSHNSCSGGKRYLGKCRISSYCYKCNTPSYSHAAARGKCKEWQTCGMNDVPLGTHLYIEGFGDFIVNDRGPASMNGAKWVDLFVNSKDCHIWTHAKVWVIE